MSMDPRTWTRERWLEEILGWAGLAALTGAAYLVFGLAGALVVIGVVLLAGSHHYYEERRSLT